MQIPLFFYKQVLLSHPDESDPSVIRVIDISAGSDVIVFESQTSEKLLRDAASEHDPFPIYNAYAPPGDVEVRDAASLTTTERWVGQKARGYLSRTGTQRTVHAALKQA